MATLQQLRYDKNWVDPRLKMPAITLPMDQLLDTIWTPETFFQNSIKVKSIPSMKGNSGKIIYTDNSSIGFFESLAITFECKCILGRYQRPQQVDLCWDEMDLCFWQNPTRI